MIFYALTSAGSRGRCWNPSMKGEGSNTFRGGPADVNVSEKHVWSVLLHEYIYLLEKFGEIASKSFFFSCTYNGTEKHVTCECFENCFQGKD